MRHVISILALVVGCYQPAASDCEYRCAASSPSCPSGLLCDGDGFCRAPGASEPTCRDDAGVASCSNPDAGALNPESCSCTTVGEQQPCFLGDNGPASRCNAGGMVTCEPSLRFGSCIGATGPAQEICFDTMDSDCDGSVINGCTCGDASNTCFDATGVEFAADRLVFVPSTVALGGSFTMYVLSKAPLFNLTYQPDSGACTGAGFQSCSVGAPCTSWFVQEFATTATSPFFTTSGPHSVTVHVGDTGNPGPCVNFSRNITGTITITN